MSDVELEDNVDESYQKPEKKSVAEIVSADSGDDALNRYKASLLGSAAVGDAKFIIDPTDERIVIPKSMEVVVDGNVMTQIDLTRDFEGATMVIKEGAEYRLRLNFFVQREIVSGLKYIHRVSKMGITVEKETYMLGSYGPRMEVHQFSTPKDKAPEGMLHRGKYKIKSKLLDDDGSDYLTWNWNLEIAKDW